MQCINPLFSCGEVIGLNALTYVFPVVTVLFILLFFSMSPVLKTAELGPGREKRFASKDFLWLAAITAVYAVTAFTGLGDTDAPQSFGHFDSSESVVLDLGSEKTVSSFMYYTGLNTGSYILEYSHDGESWSWVAVPEQKTGDLFKWKTAEFSDGAEAQTRYLRITATAELYLGEIAVRDSQGRLCTFICDRPELCDEQRLVPEYSYYLNGTYFDEIYHARTAYEFTQNVYPYELSHPPLGKLIIAVGIELFGMTPFGWRFAGTLFGVLMLPVLYVLIKRMFGGIAVPVCGTAIFAFDFMHFTQTRIATIDTYAVFFILLMYLSMYLYVSGGRLRDLALSGLFFGFGAASKWTCIYAGAGLALIWLLHWIRRLREGESFKAFLKNCLLCVGFFVMIPCLIYYLSYFAYGLAAGMNAPGMFFEKDYLGIVLDNQKFMLSYHLGVNATHPYSSQWYQWIFDIRPILYYLQYFDNGTRSSFGAFLNPVLCWAGLASMLVMAYLAVKRKDRTAGFILIGYLAQLVPWMFVERVVFEYHYFASAVFLTLALCRIFSLMENNTKYWRMSVYGLTGLSLVLFTVFYPVLSGLPVDARIGSALLRWLPTWPF